MPRAAAARRRAAPGAFFEALEPEGPEQGGELFLFLRARACADAAEDVLCRRHVGEQGVLLERIPHAPLLRREVDMLFAVEQHAAVQRDRAAVRLFDACDALERHAVIYKS